MEKKLDIIVSPYTPVELPSQMLKAKLQKKLGFDHALLPPSASKENTQESKSVSITLKSPKPTCEDTESKLFPPPNIQ